MTLAGEDQKTRISYGEFGERFIRSALTKDRIKSRVGKLVGPIEPITQQTNFGPATVHGALSSIEVLPINDTRPDLSYSLFFNVILHINLKAINAIPINWEGNFEIKVDINIETYTPLNILINYTPVSSDDIRSFIQNVDWTKFSAFDGMVKSMVCQQMAQVVNERLDAAGAARNVDVNASLTALDVPDDVSSEPDPTQGVVSSLSLDPAHPSKVLQGEKVEGSLPVGQRGWLAFFIDPTMQTELSVAARPTDKGDENTRLVVTLYNEDMEFIQEIGSQYFNDPVVFDKLTVSFYDLRTKGKVIASLSTDERDLEVRGRIIYTPLTAS